MTAWKDEDRPEPEDEPPALVYDDVRAFVRDFIAPTYRRQLGHGHYWCPQWWRHPEAVSRLSALWRAWEHLHDEPTGMASWWTYYADHNLAELMRDSGPFRDCVKGHTDRLDPLPLAEDA